MTRLISFDERQSDGKPSGGMRPSLRSISPRKGDSSMRVTLAPWSAASRADLSPDMPPPKRELPLHLQGSASSHTISSEGTLRPRDFGHKSPARREGRQRCFAEECFITLPPPTMKRNPFSANSVLVSLREGTASIVVTT